MRLPVLVVALATWSSWAFCQEHQAQATFSFGVLPQRSATLSAKYWNPILERIRAKTGVTLEMRIARDAKAHAEALQIGEYDFIYSNHQFRRENRAAGYRAFVRTAGAGIRGQIVVADESPIVTFSQLSGKSVAFPSRSAFVGYAVPRFALLTAGIHVNESFAGTQEGVMARLYSGGADAASVNSLVMAAFANRSGFRYRVLWESDAFPNIPIAAHPRIPAPTVSLIRAALIEMAQSAEGRAILDESRNVIGDDEAIGFVAVDDGDYDSHRRIYEKQND